MNLYTYEAFYRNRYQELLAEATEARLAKLGKETHTKTNQNSPKFIDDVLQKVGQKTFGIYHRLYQKGKRLNLENTNI
jgi:hypothetical protein